MKTECPHCGQHYEVEKEYIDQVVECTSCGQEFVIESIQGKKIFFHEDSPVQNQAETSSVETKPQSQAFVEAPEPSRLKALTCEMCGSTDMMKQNGVFVCQSCGTKYSLEEAKRMMIAGTVNVAGTVTVDNSVFVEKSLKNARRALEKTDWDEVEKYYNLVEQNDPQNIEAIFYSSYGKAMSSLTDADRFKRKQKFDVFCKNEAVIDDYYDPQKSKYLKPIIQGMSNNLIKMFESTFVCHPNDDSLLDGSDYPGYISFPVFFHNGDTPYTEAMFAMADVQFIESIENIIAKDERAYLYEILITHYDICLSNSRLSSDFKAKITTRRQYAAKQLKKLVPNAIINETPASGGCYIATAVYGSYECPEVWTLRRFRDYSLGTSLGGRIFVKAYYAVSPTLVKYFGKNRLFQCFWRGVLDKMVKKLNAKGVSSQPYIDKTW